MSTHTSWYACGNVSYTLNPGCLSLYRLGTYSRVAEIKKQTGFKDWKRIGPKLLIAGTPSNRKDQWISQWNLLFPFANIQPYRTERPRTNMLWRWFAVLLCHTNTAVLRAHLDIHTTRRYVFKYVKDVKYNYATRKCHRCPFLDNVFSSELSTSHLLS